MITRRIGACALALVAGVACAPRALVKQNEALTRQVAADSASFAQIRAQMTALRQRCSADSARLAALLASPSPHPVVAMTPSDSAVRARDAEIASLKDQLAKANDELDRIKRRLANPRP